MSTAMKHLEHLDVAQSSSAPSNQMIVLWSICSPTQRAWMVKLMPALDVNGS